MLSEDQIRKFLAQADKLRAEGLLDLPSGSQTPRTDALMASSKQRLEAAGSDARVILADCYRELVELAVTLETEGDNLSRVLTFRERILGQALMNLRLALISIRDARKPSAERLQGIAGKALEE